MQSVPIPTNIVWIWILFRRGVLDTILCDKVCQWLGKDDQMTKRNRNINNIIFIMFQRGTNIMANQVKTPIQNYFELEAQPTEPVSLTWQ